MNPTQLASIDETVAGVLNGDNTKFQLRTNPKILVHSIPDSIGSLVFRNGILIDEYGDYTAVKNAFSLTSNLGSLESLTARIFQLGGSTPTKMRLSSISLTAYGRLSLRLSPLSPSQSDTRDVMLFRNGLLQTEGRDYDVILEWFSLNTATPLLTTDSVFALISMGGQSASTVAIPGLVSAANDSMVFRNGLLQSEGLDFFRRGSSLLGLFQSPIQNDSFSSYSFPLSPSISSTYDGTISGVLDGANTVFFLSSFPRTLMLFLNGQYQVPGYDYLLVDALVYFLSRVPAADDVIEARVFASTEGRAYSTVLGTLTGAVDGSNVSFGIPSLLVPQVSLFKNGVLQSYGIDYVTVPGGFVMTTPPIVTDILAVQTFPSRPSIIAQSGYIPGGISGAVDGMNRDFSLPADCSQVLLFRNGQLLTANRDYLQDTIPAFSYQTDNSAGVILFKNGVLQTKFAADFSEVKGQLSLQTYRADDILVARIYPDGRYAGGVQIGGGATFLSTSDGTIDGAGLNYRVSFGSAIEFNPPAPSMLFRNGILLSPGVDYSLSGPWISLDPSQKLLPDDWLVALTSAGGGFYAAAGAVDGTNTIFTLPLSPIGVLFFRNGQLLTEGLDYVLNGSIITIVAPSHIPLAGDVITAYAFLSGLPRQVSTMGGGLRQIPFPRLSRNFSMFATLSPGEVLTSRVYSQGGPVQVTTYDGSLDYPAPSAVLIARNGIRLSPRLDFSLDGNYLGINQAPAANDVVSAFSWNIDILDPAQPQLNLPLQFSSTEGTIIGNLDGQNDTYIFLSDKFITQIMLFWNGDFQTEGVDYAVSALQKSSAGPWVTQFTMTVGRPKLDDTLDAGVFLE